MLHKNITTGDVHYIQNWSVADTTARDALTVTATDVGKVCQVTGTSTYYILTDDSPMTWQAIGSITSASNSFATIAVSGQSDVVADSSTDTLTLAAGSNITITTNAGTDTITIAASGGGSSLTPKTPVNPAGTSSVDYTALPAGLNRITVIFTACSLSGTDGYEIQIGDSGGIETTGYTGRVAYIVGNTSDANTEFNSSFYVPIGLASALVSGSLILNRISGNTWQAWGMFTVDDNTSNVIYFICGYKALSAELDRVSINTNTTNTWDSGTINIFVE